ncbi:MAG: division/cell wall cluster transcriptional repressor MraZ [Pseudomonadota bacterium]
MFRGNSFHTVDSKCRIIIPARFRDVLRTSAFEKLMISKMDGALEAYPFEEWQKLEERILNKAVKSDTIRRFRRFFIGGAYDCQFDKQGRILIPPPLREYAGIQKDIVLVGVLNHFEIWAKEKWHSEENEFENSLISYKQMRDEIAELGL